jgi:hypothetical protein
MANAKEELLGHLERNKSIIKCAAISCSLSNWYHDELAEDRRSIDLKEGYHIGEYEEFLHRLDFEYDNGYEVKYSTERYGLWKKVHGLIEESMMDQSGGNIINVHWFWMN